MTTSFSIIVAASDPPIYIHIYIYITAFPIHSPILIVIIIVTSVDARGRL